MVLSRVTARSHHDLDTPNFVEIARADLLAVGKSRHAVSVLWNHRRGQLW